MSWIETILDHSWKASAPHTHTNFAHHTSGREASADLVLLLPKNLAPATRPPSPDQIVKKCDEKTKAFAAIADATNFFAF